MFRDICEKHTRLNLDKSPLTFLMFFFKTKCQNVHDMGSHCRKELLFSPFTTLLLKTALAINLNQKNIIILSSRRPFAMN